jgi:hypothetical protein
VTVALRATAAPFLPIVIVNDASPCPADGATSSHAASVDAVHEHSRAVITAAVNRAPSAEIDD